MVMPKDMDFAAAVERLEVIVERLEHGEVPLEESSSLFEEGVELARFCSVRLNEAEKKIEQLSRDSLGKLEAKPTESVDE